MYFKFLQTTLHIIPLGIANEESIIQLNLQFKCKCDSQKVHSFYWVILYDLSIITNVWVGYEKFPNGVATFRDIRRFHLLLWSRSRSTSLTITSNIICKKAEF